MVLPYIIMNPPQVYTCSPSWILLPLPPRTIPLGRPSAPAPSILYPASNLDWWFFSHMIICMFQCHSPKSSHPRPLQFSSVQSLSHVWLSATPWTAARQAALSITNSRSSLKPVAIKSMSPKDCSLHLCLFCCLAYRVTITTFLNSLYICISILYWCFSFWLTSLCIIGSSLIHLIRTDSNIFFLMAV